MAKPAERALAERLYVLEGWSSAEIIQHVDVDKNTFYAWRAEGDWDAKRKRAMLSRYSMAEKVLDLTNTVIESLTSQPGPVDPQQVYALKALSDTSARFLGKSDPLADALAVLPDFARFAAEQPEASDEFRALLLEMGERYISKLRN